MYQILRRPSDAYQFLHPFLPLPACVCHTRSYTIVSSWYQILCESATEHRIGRGSSEDRGARYLIYVCAVVFGLKQQVR
ncbi:hypothetical protein BDW72DRAFT_888 [Aspergillus terricola var. indicus]